MKSHTAALSVFALATALLASSCDGPGAEAHRQGPLRIAATTNIVADVVRRVAGDAATVEALMGPGVDPHLYKASESDVRVLSEADVIVYSGLHLEGKMSDILEKMGRGRPVVAVTDSIPEDRLRKPPEFHGYYDPHIWFDVSLWSTAPGVVGEELARLDPENADGYRQRAAAYTAELVELDAWVAAEVATLPAERRVLVTAHDAFGYFGLRYGLEVIGIQGISTLSEAGLQDVERVVDTVVERRVPAIFVESSVPRRTIEAVLAAVKARGGGSEIGGELFSDALGAADSPQGTYVGMIHHNVETIVGALR